MNFWQRYKKIILILIVIIIIIILFVVFSKSTIISPILGPTETDTPGIDTGVLPGAEEGTGQIIDQTVIPLIPLADEIPRYLDEVPRDIIASPVANEGITRVDRVISKNVDNTSLSDDGNSIRYYDRENGQFYRLDTNGNLNKLSDKVFHDVENVYWADNADKAVLEYPDGSNIVYNFETEKQVTLPRHWEDFEFSPNSQELIMKSTGIDPDNQWLITSNDDGTQTKGLEFIGARSDYVIPSWSPNNQTVAMYTKGKDFDRQEVFFVGRNDENFKSIVVDGYGFQSQWSPEGDKLLYSVYSNKNGLKPMIWIVNAQGNNIGSGRKSLQLETWADKCTFADNRYIYCAVPESLEDGAGLFPELAFNTQDIFYRIDTLTGAKKMIATPENYYNISDLMITKDQSKLYFTDYGSNGIYKINLR